MTSDSDWDKLSVYQERRDYNFEKAMYKRYLMKKCSEIKKSECFLEKKKK